MNEGVEGRRARRRSRIVRIIRLQLVVVFVLACWRGSQVVSAWTAVRPAFLVESSGTRILSRAGWLTDDDVRSIRDASGVDSGLYSFFSPKLTSYFDAPYAASPWVRRVVDVRPAYPNRVRVFLEIREPVLGVPVDERGIHLVDERGVRLPGVRSRPPEGLTRPFYRLIGVDGPPPRAGEVWSRGTVEGAAVAGELQALTGDMVAAARIHTVDVANVGGRIDRRRPEILLETASGAVIEWGRSSRSPRAGTEPALADKVKRLRQALRTYPGLAGLDRVKLQFDRLTVVETGYGVAANAGQH